MKKMNMICLGAGVLLLLATFLPYATISGVSVNVSKFPGAAGKFMWVMAVLIAAIGALNKRWLHIVSLICAGLVLAIAFKWMSDVNEYKGSMGIGGWLLMISAAAGAVGSVLGLLGKKTSAAA